MSITRTQWKEVAGTSDGTNGSATITLDSAPAEGSLILVTLIHRATVTDQGSAVTGFTRIFERNVSQGNSSHHRGLAQFYKVAGSSESTTISCSWSGILFNVWKAVAEVFSPSTWTYLTFASNDNGATSSATTLNSGTTSSTTAVPKMLFATVGMRVGTTNQFTGLAIFENDQVSTGTVVYPSLLVGQDYISDATSGSKSVAMSWTQPNDNTGLVGSIAVFEYVEQSRKITVTDLKAPNDANSAVANATGVQVKLWVSSDSNDPTDTGAPDVLVTDATITSGTMEVTFDSVADVGNPVLGVAKWEDSNETYFFPIDTIVTEDSSGP
jgi:hypothetical protein